MDHGDGRGGSKHQENSRERTQSNADERRMTQSNADERQERQEDHREHGENAAAELKSAHQAVAAADKWKYLSHICPNDGTRLPLHSTPPFWKLLILMLHANWLKTCGKFTCISLVSPS